MEDYKMIPNKEVYSDLFIELVIYGSVDKKKAHFTAHVFAPEKLN